MIFQHIAPDDGSFPALFAKPAKFVQIIQKKNQRIAANAFRISVQRARLVHAEVDMRRIRMGVDHFLQQAEKPGLGLGRTQMQGAGIAARHTELGQGIPAQGIFQMAQRLLEGDHLQPAGLGFGQEFSEKLRTPVFVSQIGKTFRSIGKDILILHQNRPVAVARKRFQPLQQKLRTLLQAF